MATFEPQFKWKNGVISERELPIILQSVNPFVPGKDPIIAQVRGMKNESRLAATTSTELAIKAQQYTKKVEVPAEYQQFAKVFSEQESKRFPPKRAWDHAIEFKKDAPDAVDCKVYPMNRIEDKAVQKFLHDELEKGYIHESKSPYTSSFLLRPGTVLFNFSISQTLFHMTHGEHRIVSGDSSTILSRDSA